MRLLVFVAAGLMLASDAAGVHLDPRLVASGMRIQHLYHEVEELDHEIDEAAKIDPIGFIREMHARMDQVEGSECSHHEVQCGWDSFDCVSELALCDGRSDCINGWDESQDTCSHGPMVAGNVFAGMANWHSCQTWGEHPASIKITGVVTFKPYPARLGVTAHVVGNIPQEKLHIEGDLSGYYVYGSKRLVLMPVERKEMDITFVCEFNHGDDNRTDCEIIYEASHFKCAELHLHLQHRDTHHTRHHDSHDQHHDDREVDHRGEIVEHHYDIEGHDHAERFDRHHRRIDDDHHVIYF